MPNLRVAICLHGLVGSEKGKIKMFNKVAHTLHFGAGQYEDVSLIRWKYF